MNPPPFISTLLWPLSVVYGALVRRRIRRYMSGTREMKRLQGVVISVGNLTVGGAGKTPFVLWLAEKLHGEGKSIGILSRGYRGGTGTNLPALVLPGPEGKPVTLVGDEPQLMGQRFEGRVRIGVGADRWAHGRALEILGVNWFVLDDGFQHLQLARDVDIVLLDSTDPLESQRLLPAGRLREPLRGLARADMIVITRADHAPAMERMVRAYSQAPVFYARTHLRRVRHEASNETASQTAEWLGKPMFAFSAIGNPGSFRDDLIRWGMAVLSHATFRDHHRYTARQVRNLEHHALTSGAEALICTEKDARNLGGLRFTALPLFVCEISMVPNNEALFLQELTAILERKRARRAP